MMNKTGALRPPSAKSRAATGRVLTTVGLGLLAAAVAAIWKLAFDYLADSYILLVLAVAAAAVTIAALVRSRLRRLHRR